MSKIYVAEYPGLANAATGDGGSVAILAVPPTVEYTVIVSATSKWTAAAVRAVNGNSLRSVATYHLLYRVRAVPRRHRNRLCGTYQLPVGSE